MADIASLAVVIDTTQADQATARMEKFTRSATAADAATDKLASTSQRMNSEMRNASQVNGNGLDVWGRTAAELEQHLARTGQQANQTGAALNGVTGQLVNMASTGQASIAPVVASLLQAGTATATVGKGAVGARTALAALGAGVAAELVNPLNLAVLAIGLVAFGVEALYRAWEGDAKSVTDVIKEQQDAIKGIKEAYDEAAKGADRYSQAALALATNAQQRSIEDTQKAIKEQVDAINAATMRVQAGEGAKERGWLSMIPNPFADISHMINSGLVGSAATGGRELTEIIEKFRQTVKAGQPDVVGFVHSLQDLRGTDITPYIREQVDALLDQNKTVVELVQNLDKLTGQYQAVAAAIERMDAAAKAVRSFIPDVRQTPESQISGATQTRVDAIGVQSRNQPSNPQAALEAGHSVTAALTEQAIALQKVADADKLTAQANDLAIKAVRARTAEEKAAIAVEQVLLEARKATSEGGAEITAREQKAAEAAGALVKAREAQAAADAQRARYAGMASEIRDLQNQIALVGQSAGETARLRAEYQLLAQAKAAYKNAGGIIPPDEVEKIKEAAAAIGQLTDQLKTAQFFDQAVKSGQEFIAQQRLEAATLGMTAEQAAALRYEFELLNQARQAGINLSPQQIADLHNLAQQMAATEAAAKRLSDAYNFGRDLFRSFAQDFGANLRQGESLWKAFADAAINALQRIADKLLQSAFDQIFNSLWSGLMGSISGTSSTSSGGLVGALVNSIVGTGSVGSGGVASSVASAVTPAVTKTVSTSILDASAAAIRQIESGSFAGNYNAIGPWTGKGYGVGAYQVMDYNVGPWTQKYLGSALTPDQFRMSPSAQDTVFRGEFGSYIDKYGIGQAGQAWIGGPGSVGSGGVVKDILGTSGAKYQQMFESNLSKLGISAGSAANSVSGLGATSTATMGALTEGTKAATQGLGNFANNLSNIFPPAPGGGGGIGGLLGGLFGGLSSAFSGTAAYSWIQAGGGGLYARGGVFDRGISGYSNSIVDSPTLFRFAAGTGLMGEAGPEAILPLHRDASGKLGVRSGGGGSGSTVRLIVEAKEGRMFIPTVRAESQDVAVQVTQAGLQHYDESVLPSRIGTAVNDPRVR